MPLMEPSDWLRERIDAKRVEIADLERTLAAKRALLAEYEGELRGLPKGLVSPARPERNGVSSEAVIVHGLNLRDPLHSQIEAVLHNAKGPMRARDITKILASAGVVSLSKRGLGAMVAACLRRHRLFKNVRRGTYGLTQGLLITEGAK